MVGIIGIGASEYGARAAAHYYRTIGVRAFSISASEIITTKTSEADFYLVISESGRSSEVLRAVAILKSENNITASKMALITNFPDSPLGSQIPNILPLNCGEDSAVYTIGFTATLQALGIIGEYWSGTKSDWSKLSTQVAEVITKFKPIAQTLVPVFDDLALVDVIGTGIAIASAGEGALLLREAAHLRTAFHETYNYLHGPMEPLESNVGAIVIGSGREIELATYLTGLKCPVLLLTQNKVSIDSATTYPLPIGENPMTSAIFEIVGVQLVAYHLAKSRGLKVDGFRYKQEDTKIV